MSDETTGPEDGFEQDLAARLAEAAGAVERVPTRAGVDGAVGLLVARRHRVRRAGALVAAAVLAVGGIAVAGIGDDGPAPVEVATGSSSTSPSSTVPACDEEASGEELYESADPNCGDTACFAIGPQVVGGIQVAYGYDWGIDLESGEIRFLDQPFGPEVDQPGLVVLTPQQGSVLFEDAILDIVPDQADEAAGLLVTRELAEHLVQHGTPVTAAQLGALHLPAAGGGGTVVTQALFAPADLATGCPGELPVVTEGVPGTSTSTSSTLTTVPETTTTVPETTTTVPEVTITAPPPVVRPPALLDLVEGGSAWAVYLAVLDGRDGAALAGLDAARARATAEGYHAEFVSLACDRGAAASLGLDPASTWVTMALYFSDEAAARSAASLFAPQVDGPASVRTHCVDTELDGTPYGETGDSDREQSSAP